MFKKLDKLIVKAFIGPFIAVFFITLFVLVMQFFWLWIDEFIGKGLSAGVIMEFIWYQSAALIPMALPLAVLLSSLMTFGNLGETMELVAIKSAGISLLRFMRPLFIVTLFLCVAAFLVSNYVIPVANLKSKTLLQDIVYAKPAFNLKEGVFYDELEGFAIKIGAKDNDSNIRDVIIYERGNSSLQDNFIIAKRGVMRVGENKRFLEMNLRDGWTYQERGNLYEKNTEFIRIGFKEYKKQIDMSSFEFKRSADSFNRTHQRMQSLRQLEKAIDSLKRELGKFETKVENDIFNVFAFHRYIDSGYRKPVVTDSQKVRSFNELIPDSVKYAVNQDAASRVGTTMLNTEIAASDYKIKAKDLRLHQIEWHRKLTMSVAPLVLFLIGAPLGSIIRKGGLGTPLIIAVLFFMFFFFFNTTGEKYVKEGVLTSFSGMWMATLVLFPLGLFLIYKALHDSQLFNKEYYFRTFGRIRQLIRFRAKSTA